MEIGVYSDEINRNNSNQLLGPGVSDKPQSSQKGRVDKNRLFNYKNPLWRKGFEMKLNWGTGILVAIIGFIAFIMYLLSL